MLDGVALCNVRYFLDCRGCLILIVQEIWIYLFNLICEHNQCMSSCFIKVFRDYSRMSNVSGLYHNHISGAEPFIFLLIVKLIVNKHFRVPVNLTVFDIVRFKVKMTVWNIVRSCCSDECISDIFIYGTELTLFPRNLLFFSFLFLSSPQEKHREPPNGAHDAIQQYNFCSAPFSRLISSFESSDKHSL